MFFKKRIVVTIGYNGTIIAFHAKNSIKQKFFFEKFDSEAVLKLKPYFTRFKRANISILLDTVDQTYKKKFFPAVRKMDLKNLVRRELGGITNKDSLKSFFSHKVIHEKSKSGKITKKWDTVLITAALNEEINQWIDFLFEMPNMIEGIHAAPIEAFNIIKKIKKTLQIAKEKEEKKRKPAKKDKKKKKNKKINNDKKEDSHNKITCLVLYTKVNGFRQVIFTKHGIEFTRIVNYDLTSDDFLKNYEQDIYSSYEYLKRNFSELKIEDLDIINILPPQIIEKVKNIDNMELQINSYTPNEAARIIGFKEGMIAKGSEFADLLLSRSLFKFKNLLKFRIPKMIATSKMYLVMKGSYYLYLFLIIFFFVEFLVNINIRLDYDKKIDAAEISMFKSTEALHKIQNKVLNTTNESGKNINIEQAIDIGKIHDVMKDKTSHIFKLYKDFGYIKNYDIVLTRFNYIMEGYNRSSPQKNSKYKLSLSGKLYNKTGNIDSLFNQFDSIDKDSKNIIKGHSIKFSKIPRNIDFNKKYYEFPLDFTISSK